MNFLCYIFDTGFEGPTLQPLAAMTREAAAREADALFRDRPQTHSIELWDGRDLVQTVHRDPRDPSEGDKALSIQGD